MIFTITKQSPEKIEPKKINNHLSTISGFSNSVGPVSCESYNPLFRCNLFNYLWKCRNSFPNTFMIRIKQTGFAMKASPTSNRVELIVSHIHKGKTASATAYTAHNRKTPPFKHRSNWYYYAEYNYPIIWRVYTWYYDDSLFAQDIMAIGAKIWILGSSGIKCSNSCSFLNYQILDNVK